MLYWKEDDSKKGIVYYHPCLYCIFVDVGTFMLSFSDYSAFISKDFQSSDIKICYIIAKCF